MTCAGGGWGTSRRRAAAASLGVVRTDGRFATAELRLKRSTRHRCVDGQRSEAFAATARERDAVLEARSNGAQVAAQPGCLQPLGAGLLVRWTHSQPDNSPGSQPSVLTRDLHAPLRQAINTQGWSRRGPQELTSDYRMLCIGFAAPTATTTYAPTAASYFYYSQRTRSPHTRPHSAQFPPGDGAVAHDLSSPGHAGSQPLPAAGLQRFGTGTVYGRRSNRPTPLSPTRARSATSAPPSCRSTTPPRNDRFTPGGCATRGGPGHVRTDARGPHP